MKHQTTESQKGEIEFRKKLSLQQTGGCVTLKGEFDVTEIRNVLNERMKETFEHLSALREKGVSISPYLEIGAERGQRSLVMENDLKCTGASLDISFDSLRSCEHYGKIFNKNKTPLRICCDINNLPFMDNSVPFVFCYQTLHHFPDPASILREIHRVLLPGGNFFFSEEPCKKMLHLNLYTKKEASSKNESKKIRTIDKIIDYFFADKHYIETDFGITENFDVSIRAWKKSLSAFEIKEMKVKTPVFGDVDLCNTGNFPKVILAYLLGGLLSCICRKSGNNSGNNIQIIDTLACTVCRLKRNESRLARKDSFFECNKCGNKFPVIDGVIFLLSNDKFKELYPDIFSKQTHA
jgi:ubiquinone/menaquinone biosynthesis C-methylase UbiE/uncharacterized protein YbaR (Trm112 family)